MTNALRAMQRWLLAAICAAAMWPPCECRLLQSNRSNLSASGPPHIALHPLQPSTASAFRISCGGVGTHEHSATTDPACKLRVVHPLVGTDGVGATSGTVIVGVDVFAIDGKGGKPCIGCVFYGTLKLEGALQFDVFALPVMSRAGSESVELRFRMGPEWWQQPASQWQLNGLIASINFVDEALPIPTVPQQCGYTIGSGTQILSHSTVWSSFYPEAPYSTIASHLQLPQRSNKPFHHTEEGEPFCASYNGAGHWRHAQTANERHTDVPDIYQWKEDGCRTKSIGREAFSKCLVKHSGRMAFVGDSTLRNLFYDFVSRHN